MININSYIIEKLKIDKNSVPKYIPEEGDEVLIVRFKCFKYIKGNQYKIDFYAGDFKKNTLEGSYKASFKLNKAGYYQMISMEGTAEKFIVLAIPKDKGVSFMKNVILPYTINQGQRLIKKERLYDYLDTDELIKMWELKDLNEIKGIMINEQHTQGHIERTLNSLEDE